MKAVFARKLVTPTGKNPRRGEEMNDVKILENVYVLFDEEILDISKEKPGVEVISEVDLLTPGFVDCHTHIPFYGYRAKEFVMRSQGAKYVDILKAGGGIHSTVRMVREAKLEELVGFNARFLNEMMKRGVTSLEGKSGYGLGIETELKQLRALNVLNEKHPIDIFPTFLGAHALPKDKDPWEYLEKLVENFDRVKEYTNAIDIFVDDGAYSIDQAKWYLSKAKENGFRIRLHADEIKRTGSAILGVELGAVSVDHLLKITGEDIEIISKSNTTAVMMPATSFYLGEEYAPARKLIDAGAIVALGSDFNPGSNTINDPTLVMHLAVSKLKMSPEEALTSFTLNSSHVLGISEKAGTLERGKYADMIGWNVSDLEAIPYLPAHDTVSLVIKRGFISKNLS